VIRFSRRSRPNSSDRRPLEKITPPSRRVLFPQIAPGDLDVAVLGQLPATQLPIDDKLEPGPLEVERLQAPLGRRGLIE